MKTLTIMIVDDEAPIRFVIKRFLSLTGYRIIEASNGLDVLPILQREQDAGQSVDIMLMDVCMPGCSGLEVLKQMASANICPRVLLMSGTFDDLEIPAEFNNCFGILHKPFAIRELMANMEQLMKSLRVRDNSEFSSVGG